MTRRIDAQTIAQGLGKFSKSGDGFMACCPAHDDNTPSLSIGDGVDGKVLVHCFGGCPQNRVIDRLEALGLWHERTSVTDAKPAQQQLKPKDADYEVVAPVPADAPPIDFKSVVGFEPTSTFTYRNAKGEVMFIVARIDHDKE